MYVKPIDQISDCGYQVQLSNGKYKGKRKFLEEGYLYLDFLDNYAIKVICSRRPETL